MTQSRLQSNNSNSTSSNPSLEDLSTSNGLINFIVAKSGGIEPALKFVEQVMANVGRQQRQQTLTSSPAPANIVSGRATGSQNANADRQQTKQMTPNRASLATGMAGSNGAMQFGTPTLTPPSKSIHSYNRTQAQTPTTPAPDTPILSTSMPIGIMMVCFFDFLRF